MFCFKNVSMLLLAYTVYGLCSIHKGVVLQFRSIKKYISTML